MYVFALPFLHISHRGPYQGHPLLLTPPQMWSLVRRHLHSPMVLLQTSHSVRSLARMGRLSNLPQSAHRHPRAHSPSRHHFSIYSEQNRRRDRQRSYLSTRAERLSPQEGGRLIFCETSWWQSEPRVGRLENRG